MPQANRMLPVSVLDLSPVVSGSSGPAALRNSLDLAALADRLGFGRYWVAEHHNLPSIASSAPEIMIGLIASATSRIRVGSGGVMLPNHAPLMVAERFKVLEALFPGRIDLGLGRVIERAGGQSGNRGLILDDKQPILLRGRLKRVDRQRVRCVAVSERERIPVVDV